MKESELKIGIKVKAILREDGKHIIVGEILSISLDDHPYRETFVSLNVSGGDVNDDRVHLMIRDNVNVSVPAVDVLEIYSSWFIIKSICIDYLGLIRKRKDCLIHML